MNLEAVWRRFSGSLRESEINSLGGSPKGNRTLWLISEINGLHGLGGGLEADIFLSSGIPKRDE